jgi:hypothetical protein
LRSNPVYVVSRNIPRSSLVGKLRRLDANPHEGREGNLLART